MVPHIPTSLVEVKGGRNLQVMEEDLQPVPESEVCWVRSFPYMQ